MAAMLVHDAILHFTGFALSPQFFIWYGLQRPVGQLALGGLLRLTVYARVSTYILHASHSKPTVLAKLCVSAHVHTRPSKVTQALIMAYNANGSGRNMIHMFRR